MVSCTAAVPADAGELYTLQLACWVQEMHDNPGVEIPALHETYDDLRAWLPEWTVLVLRREGRLIGAARARREGDAWDIGRLMVVPDLQGQGLGRFLLAEIERAAPDDVTTYSLFTGAGSLRNQRMYKRAGYRLRGELEPGVVVLTKPRSAGLISDRPGALWQTLPLASSAEGPCSEYTSNGSASGTCHRGYRTPPATRQGHTAEHIFDTAADLWHSRGET